ncbi:MAG: hypothetical protein ACRDZ2_07310, partial [Ilumatobacteraceae bacterium]
RSAGSGVVFDVIDLGAPEALDRLRRYATGQATRLPGFWDAEVGAEMLDFGGAEQADRERARPGG